MTPFIDAVVIKGQTKQFTCSIQIRDEQNVNFIPFDLSSYSIRFKVMGAPTADATVLVEHIITQATDLETVGQITNAQAGEFTFAITAEDTKALGLGKKPIMIDIIMNDTNELVFSLNEGGSNGEFNKVYIVQA
ncbi:MAG: hypothetical protein NC218_08325 [Acetobacter sp.]|nr:hypothetical protein [Acetobacter sp.]